MEFILKLERETKGALLYSIPKDDQNDDNAVWSLYLRKKSFSGKPETIKLTVEPVEAGKKK